MSKDRIYRPVEPSDLPKIQAGTLQAFYNMYHGQIPAELLSTNMKGPAPTLWLLHNKDGDTFALGNDRIDVDVTPEKRYAIWNHKQQRFCSVEHHPTTRGFPSKQDAEIWLQENIVNKTNNFYIVEWEIKQDE